MTERSFEESILWSHHTAIVAIDGSRCIRYANRAARELLSSEGRSLDGNDILDLFDGHEGLAQAFRRAAHTKREQTLELPFRRGNNVFRIGLTLSWVADPDMPLTFSLVMHDIEHHLLLDERLRQLERITAAERLIGGFAHQLRNPLAAISALIENLAAETPAEDPRIEYTERVLNQVAQMEELIRSCVAFSPDLSVAQQRTTAAHIGRAAIDAFASRHGVVPRLVVEEGAEDVVVNEKQVTKCLRLLMERAYESCGDAGKMSLLVSRDPVAAGTKLVRFVVTDEGPAIDKGDLGMLFEPFFTTGAKGVGLGLAIAQILALRNGGMLEVLSMADGTQLILRLPVTENVDC